MKYEHDRTGEPSLAEMTEAAIKALGQNGEGFYLNIEAGRVDLSPLVSRHIGLTGVSAELAAMDGPTPPGTAVVTEFRT